MCVNVGVLDRLIRVILGIALIVYGLSYNNYIIAVIGAIPLVTGVIGFCPLYLPFKINTGCRKE